MQTITAMGLELLEGISYYKKTLVCPSKAQKHLTNVFIDL